MADELIVAQPAAEEKGPLHRERRGRAGPPGHLSHAQRTRPRRSPPRSPARFAAGRRRPGDFAIFYRTNALSRSFEFALREAGVPYQMVNGVEFFQRKEIKDVLAYLQLAQQSARRSGPAPRDQHAGPRHRQDDDRAAGATIADAPRHYRCWMPPAASAAIEAIAARAARLVAELRGDRRSPGRRGRRPDRGTARPGAQRDRLRGHAARLRRRGRRGAAGQHPGIARPSPGSSTNAIRATGHLEAFLEETALVNDTDDWETQLDRVTLMTLHASKGLEFPCVFIVAVEEGLLPHERSRSAARPVGGGAAADVRGHHAGAAGVADQPGPVSRFPRRSGS